MLQIESFNDEELDPATSKNIFSINKKPIQTRIKYPETNKRKFQSKWFDEHTWLEYSVSTDSAYCFCCRHFNNINFFNGFKAWKNPKRFYDHAKSDQHKKSNEFYLNRINKDDSVAVKVGTQHSEEVKKNRAYLKFLIQTITHLAKQGQSYRGHLENDQSHNKGNFIELLELRLLDRPEFLTHFSSSSSSYVGHSSQKEILDLVAKQIRQNLIPKECFAIILDETADLGRIEQVSFCLRWVDSDLLIHEHFIGFYSTATTTGDALFDLTKTILKEFILFNFLFI
jgi:hypothetical protein